MRRLAARRRRRGAVAISVAAAAEPGLIEIVERGDRAAALAMLAKGANPNTPGPDGTTALMWAAANDDVELVRALVKAGADVKAKNHFGTSAITEAAILGSAPIIDVLLKAGADANFTNPEGETPLMAAARSGKVEAARLLIEAGADVNARETFGQQTALMWASAQRPGRDGEVPGVEGRRPQRPRRHPPVGAQGHHRAASQGHEPRRLHAAALRRARGLRRVREAPARGRRRSRPRGSRAHHATGDGADEPALRGRGGARQRRRRRGQVGLLRPLAALHGGRRQHPARPRATARWRCCRARTR